MGNFIQQLQWLVEMSQHNLNTLFYMVAGFFAIQILNTLVKYRLNVFGIMPRDPGGLFGVLLAPLLHGSFSHFFFNMIPFFLLANFILLLGLAQFLAITLIITVVSGLCVWLVGRKAIHVGASGLIMGYWGFLLIGAIMAPSITLAFLIIICLYYFGGFVSSLLPEQGNSWESHFFGFAAGVATYYFHLQDALVPFFTKLIY